MGPGRVGLGQPSLVWFWVWKISPKNPNFFPLRIKKIASGRVKKYPGQRQVSLLFTAGQNQKYAGGGSRGILPNALL